jgi:hypothetical protein
MTRNSQKVLEWRAANPDRYRRTQRQASRIFRQRRSLRAANAAAVIEAK